MKILLVPAWYPSKANPFDGSFFAEQAEFLANSGHEVVVLAPRNCPIYRWRGYNLRPETSETRSFSTAATSNSLPHASILPSKTQDASTTKPQISKPQVINVELPVFPRGTRLIEKWVTANGAAQTKHYLQKILPGFSPDVVHVHSLFPALPLGSYIAKLFQAPLVFTEHRPSSLQRPKTGVRGRMLQKGIRQARICSTVSTPFAQLLQTHWQTNDPWEVLYLPVADKFLHSNPPTNTSNTPTTPGPNTSHEPLTFVHISHLDEGKRLDLLLKAFAKFATKEPAQLLVGGGTPEKIAPYQQIATELGLGNTVKFLGQLTREQVFTTISQAHWFVLPSVVENGGTVISEAQCLGVPVISTRTWAGQSSALKIGRILVNIDDVDDLSKALEQAANLTRNNSIDISALKQQARARYSQAAFVNHSEDIYRRAQIMHPRTLTK